MPTAQVARAAYSIIHPLGNVAYQSQIPTLQGKVGAGKVIYYSDINAIKGLITSMAGHYHQYTDAYQLATYGAGYGDNPSAGDRNNYYTPGGRNTGYAYGVQTGDTLTGAGPATGGDFKQAGVIRASDYNAMNTRIKTLRYHRHGIVDRTSA